MECKKLLEELSNYIDHDIDPQICDAIENHLYHCSPCQVFIESLKKTVQVFKDKCPEKEVPEDCRKRLRDRLREKAHRVKNKE